MSTSSSSIEQLPEVVTVFQNELESSSEEPPIEEWSSLIISTTLDSPKKVLQKQGLYEPGSGEICTKYIPMSDSEVLRYVYYNYPAVLDPGINEALLKAEPMKVFDNNGQDLYLHLCGEMNITPVRNFHRGLTKDEINLKYYGVNPLGVRAMCLALTNNRYVKRLDLTSNYLNEDACYHLGQLLGDSFALEELVLASCRIKAEGMRRLLLKLAGRTMNVLDLSKNDFGDDGFQYLANKITRGTVIRQLNLSYNNLTHTTALAFAEALQGNKSITHLDLSWNKLFPLQESNDLLRQLGDSKILEELNLSWNNLTTGILLRKILTIPTIRVLNLSNNRLLKLYTALRLTVLVHRSVVPFIYPFPHHEPESFRIIETFHENGPNTFESRLSQSAAKALNLRLQVAKKLHTLDLSYNPFTPDQAFMILTKLREEEVLVENILMDDIGVTKEFVNEMNEILSLKYRANTKITYGWVIHNYTLSMPDLRRIVMRRLDYVACSGQKNCKLDIMIYFLEEHKKREQKIIQPREIMYKCKRAGFVIDESLTEELCNLFPGPKLEKGGKTINLEGVVEYIKRIWPEKRLPPTPPPAPEPEPVKRGKKKTKKAKAKK